MGEYYKNKVIIVGCGPGLKAYISPKALYYVKKADILVGSGRLLKLFPGVDAEKIILEKNYDTLVDRISTWSAKRKVVVLVSGDPCFFSYAKMIVKKMGSESCLIIPGISSVQLAFAAIGESWDDASFISLHGRNNEYERLVEELRQHKKVGILTDQRNTPCVIARQLVKCWLRGWKMYVCENLSMPSERISEFELTRAMKG